MPPDTVRFQSGSAVTLKYAGMKRPAKPVQPMPAVLVVPAAGHTPLLCLPGSGSDAPGLRLLAPDGMVLGLNLDDGRIFERLLQEETINLHEGDLFLLFTDGITEAMDATDEEYGPARLIEHFVQPEACVDSLISEVQRFGKGSQHTDDATALLIRSR